MKDNLSVIAVVPARGGDHEVPYLNIKKLGSLPLVAHTLTEAGESRYIDRLIVSTDDDQVAEIAREYGAEVPFRRPDALAEDISELQAVVRHAVETIEAQDDVRFDIVITLQATSPFRTAKQIDDAIDKLVDEGLDSVISVNEVRSLTWHLPHGKLEPLFERAGRRDELAPLFHEDGAIRAVARGVLDGASRLGDRIGHVVMDKMSALTVHDIYDFWLAEKLVRLPRVLFRVDGGSEMGMGHVVRSLAVAEALKDIVSHADICFLMRADRPEGVQQISNSGHAVRVVPGGDEGSLTTIVDVIRDYSPNIIINDQPFLDSDYLAALAGIGASTINLVDSLDDIENPEELASIIIATMQESDVALDDVHAGPSFAILRESFRARARDANEIAEKAHRVVLSFGGSDPQNLTVKTLRALRSVPELSVTVVLGPAFAFLPELEAAASGLARPPTVVKNVEHMADILFEADLVLCSGGMTVFEIAALGRPGIVMCQNVRERERMESFARYGTIEHLGLGTEVTEETILSSATSLLNDREGRKRMSDAGSKLVDAEGTRRVYEVLKKAGSKGPANGGRWL